jgi:uncharacterized protein (TIGR02186 family)
MIRALCLGLALLAAPASASETIVAGLSQSRVSITANFDGSEILIYGAVKRDAPEPEDAPMQVIVTVEGPSAPLTIRRKEWTAGIWINRSAVSVASAPSFYAVATSGALESVLSSTDDLRHRITLDQVIRDIGITAQADNSDDFITALKRIRVADGSYRLDNGTVSLKEQTLFRADVQLPANLTEGAYRVRIFLTRNGKVIDTTQQRIFVHKDGLERFLFNMAKQQSFLYGLASLTMAVVAGWAASAGFRLLRRR